MKSWQFHKDAADVRDYSIDWSSDLTSGETISTSVWAADTGITVASYSNTDTTSTVWLSGGTLAAAYTVYNTITTSAGQTIKRYIRIFIGAINA